MCYSVTCRKDFIGGSAVPLQRPAVFLLHRPLRFNAQTLLSFIAGSFPATRLTPSFKRGKSFQKKAGTLPLPFPHSDGYSSRHLAKLPSLRNMGRTEESPRPNRQVSKFLENLHYCLLKPLVCPLVRLALGGDLSMSLVGLAEQL